MYIPSLEMIYAIQDPVLTLIVVMFAVAVLVALQKIFTDVIFTTTDYRDEEFEALNDEEDEAINSLPVDTCGFSTECKNKCLKVCNKHITVKDL